MLERTLYLRNGLLVQLIAKRYLTKSAQGPRPEKSHHRLWAMPGDHVYYKDILARQHTMKWHPGLNAGIDDHRTIYALCDGVMIITEEKFNPDWENHIVNGIYKVGERERAPPYMRYINVIPRKRISEFKLIDLV